MSAADYLLYDNRTWAPGIGEDWGLKVATGALAAQQDLRSAFVRYCHALPDDHGHLHKFGCALGGIRAGSQGYLLCVTLETSDSFGRPSWATYGLWFSNEDLQHALRLDIIASVELALQATEPPATITLQRKELSLFPTDAGIAVGSKFRRHRQSSTPPEVQAILSDAARTGRPLPDILGVTSSSRLTALGQDFDLVYCHPTDERAERAFTMAARNDAPSPKPVAPPSIRAKSSSFPFATLYLIVGAIALAGIAAAIFWMQSRASRSDLASPSFASQSANGLRGTRQTTSKPGAPEGHDTISPEIIRELDAITRLKPEQLRSTQSYRFLSTTEVLTAHQNDRQKVQNAFSTLIEIRERVAGRDWVDSGRGPAAEAWSLRELHAVFHAQPASNACGVIRDAFGFEFETPHSPVRTWCDSLVKVERATETPIDPNERGGAPRRAIS